jgi:pimeloyl-ACP methyl ester carboxylesterase
MPDVPEKRKLLFYEKGSTSQFACTFDQRFSFCLHVPHSYDEQAAERWPLIVLIHGTERGSQKYRDLFARFADEQRAIVLAPLFPCGIEEPLDLENYKFIAYRGIRFDRVLLAMIEQIGARYHLDADKFLIHGFSGGGHFVHRFLYLHPQRLRAASIGAPGMVTLLDPTLPWWVGTADLQQRFGIELNVEAMREVAIQMAVGAADVETWEITVPPDSPLFMPGVNEAGRTRIERLRALAASFERQGINVRFDLVSGVAHEGWHPQFIRAVQDFFAGVLSRRSASDE